MAMDINLMNETQFSKRFGYQFADFSFVFNKAFWSVVFHCIVDLKAIHESVKKDFITFIPLKIQ